MQIENQKLVDVTLKVFIAFLVISSLNYGYSFYQMISREVQMSVNGESKIKAIPDVAYLNFSINAHGDNLKLAEKQANEKYNNLYKVAMKAGVDKEDININSSYTNPTYNPNGGQNGEYDTTKNVIIEISDKDPKKLQEKIDSLFRGTDEAGFGFGTNSCLSFEDTNETLKSAKEKAFLDANSRAISMSKAYKMRITGINSINDNTPNYYYNPTLGYYGQCLSVAILNGEIKPLELNASVSVGYNLKK